MKRYRLLNSNGHFGVIDDEASNSIVGEILKSTKVIDLLNNQSQIIAEQQVEIEELKEAKSKWEIQFNVVQEFRSILEKQIKTLENQLEKYQDMEFTKEHCDLYAENELLKKQLERGWKS